MGSISSAVNINHDGDGLGGWGNVVFLEDHDQAGAGNGSGAQRVPVRIDSTDPTGIFARKRSMLGSAITLTTAGMPMLLQGEEMLTTNQFGADIPIQWSLTNTYSTVVAFYTDLISLRRNLTGRSSGLEGMNTQTIWTDNTNQIIAYHRWSTGASGDDVVVICNFTVNPWPAYTINNGGGNLGFPQTGVWYTQLNSDWTTYSSDFGNYGSLSTTVSTYSAGATISIAPYSVLILSQNLPGPPPTPRNVAVTSVTTNEITIGWTLSSTATGYIVKRGGSQIATTSTNSYTDTAVTMGANYCYTVAATNNLGGVSAYSTPPACATTLSATSATNLLAYWTFDENSGSIAYDYSGNTNTGNVVLGGGNWINGMVNGALHFDGQYTKVTVSNSPSLNPVKGITIAAWVYDNSGGWQLYPRIVEKGASDNQYALFANPSGQLEFLLAGVTNGTITVSPPSSFAWHHLAGTYDGSSLISLYIDGQLATQQVASGTLALTTDALAIGAKPSGGDSSTFFSGNIDDVRIYGSSLPAAQISQLHNIDSVGDGIPDWWRLQYFGSSSSTGSTTCAACDADGTGQNNTFKYIAGLDPTNPASVFTLQIVPQIGQTNWQNLLFSPQVAGRTYTPQFSTDLVNGVWMPLTTYTGLLTNGNQVTITDTNPISPQEFYRLQISQP